MKIEDAFPEDPFQPSIKWAGITQAPITVPWAQKRVRFGAGFNTQQEPADDLFTKHTAFDLASLQRVRLLYRQCQSTSLLDNSTVATSDASEHCSFSLDASVGGKLLGVSGRGSYEKSVRDNANSSKMSVRAEHTCGQVEPVEMLGLSRAAIQLLANSPNPADDFRTTFGDFFVGGFRLGALNFTMVLGDLAGKSSFEAKRAQLKIKVLFTINKDINDVSESASAEGAISICAFDSIASSNITFCARTWEESMELAKVAAENRQQAMKIASRAAEALLQEYGLDQGGVITPQSLESLCDRGFVTELLLIPYASLRDYRSMMALRSSSTWS